MKKILFAIALLVFAPHVASAAEATFPAQNPFAQMTIPDDWSPKVIETGVQAQSPDGSVFFTVEPSNAGAIDKSIGEAIDFLGTNGVTINTDSLKKTDTTLNGFSVLDMAWDGNDKDGPAKIGLTIVVGESEKQVLLLTYWASPEGEKKYQDTLMSIITSLKPVK